MKSTIFERSIRRASLTIRRASAAEHECFPLLSSRGIYPLEKAARTGNVLFVLSSRLRSSDLAGNTPRTLAKSCGATPLGSFQSQLTTSTSSMILRGRGARLRSIFGLMLPLTILRSASTLSRCRSRTRPTRLKLWASCCILCSMADEPSASASAKDIVLASIPSSFCCLDVLFSPFSDAASLGATLSDFLAFALVVTFKGCDSFPLLSLLFLCISCLLGLPLSLFLLPPPFFHSATAFFFQTSFFASLIPAQLLATSLFTA
mmetsp:Transcript_13101/g.31026  ORF Transcript_13101/g.31026 Transcript_13101/m.31026 type:complete len:262 (-) Transcript_13101:1016-1801(-)